MGRLTKNINSSKGLSGLAPQQFLHVYMLDQVCDTIALQCKIYFEIESNHPKVRVNIIALFQCKHII